MKIHIDNVNLTSSSGPNSFAKRLVQAFLLKGIDVVDSGIEADVSLVFIEPSGRPLAKRIVQRLDGIWFKPSEFESKNRRILDLYRRADGVIWQSNFDREMTTRWWGEPRAGAVILNGIEPQTPSVNASLQTVREKYKRVFVSSANWHPQKRLRSNIECFSHLQREEPSSCLIVMGSSPDCWVPSPHVMYTGPLRHEDCHSVFSIADWMIHLAWVDHCPNVVVEALSCNIPVICADSGGTKELVKDFGLIVPENKPYQYELADYDNPPSIDVSKIQLPTSLGACADITMNRVVQQYVDLLNTF